MKSRHYLRFVCAAMLSLGAMSVLARIARSPNPERRILS